jgi:hypothetical protein
LLRTIPFPACLARWDTIPLNLIRFLYWENYLLFIL